MKIFLRYWLPVFVWLGVIFIGSTDLMSADHTSRFIAPFLRWLKPDISDATIATVQFFVRKAAHVSEYAVLVTLLARALRGTYSYLTNGRMALLAFLLAVVVAASDEYHQSFVVSRTASPYDVMIDACGALLGLTLFWFFTARKRQVST